MAAAALLSVCVPYSSVELLVSASLLMVPCCAVLCCASGGVQVQTRKLRISGDLDFHAISKRTPGFVGADLAALVKEAAALAVKRCFQRLTQQGPELQQQQQQQGAPASSAASAALPDAPGAASSDPEGAAALERTMAWSNRARNQAPLTSSELEGLSITMADFEEAVSKVRAEPPSASLLPLACLLPACLCPRRKVEGASDCNMRRRSCCDPQVQPSVRREGFATTPGVTWDDVGSLKDVRCVIQGPCCVLLAPCHGLERQEPVVWKCERLCLGFRVCDLGLILNPKH